MHFEASRRAIPRTWCGQLAEAAVGAGFGRFGWGDGPNLGLRARGCCSYPKTRGGPAEARARSLEERRRGEDRRRAAAAAELGIPGSAWRPESSARPPHLRSIGAAGGGNKAQEWCKACGGLWEGWKRGTDWGVDCLLRAGTRTCRRLRRTQAQAFRLRMLGRVEHNCGAERAQERRGVDGGAHQRAGAGKGRFRVPHGASVKFCQNTGISMG